MSDFKSKLPDLKELGSMTGKLFQDVKKSVTEIIKDYKEKRTQDTQPQAPTEAPAEAEAPKESTQSEDAEKIEPKTKTTQSKTNKKPSAKKSDE